VILLHGGPGAPGYMAPIARRLSASFRVVEPFQRPSGGSPLTVQTHIDDLDEVVAAGGEPVLLAGSSWGAMLGLAYAASHPSAVLGIALIGCGTFDRASRRTFEETVIARTDAVMRRQLAEAEAMADADRRLIARIAILAPAYSHDLVTSDLEFESVDARANRETWNDMLRLQEAGVYPRALAAIRAPVLMLHGAVDPHPGTQICESLRPFLPQLEYREWPACGHYPWLERDAYEAFFETLVTWLRAVARSAPPSSR
jgi:pimeloyl-ACP methyl ester carboxylesterase